MKDVYKRQFLDGYKLLIWLYLLECAVYGLWMNRDSAGPVSYTHLDVYKRQDQHHQVASGGFKKRSVIRHSAQDSQKRRHENISQYSCEDTKGQSLSLIQI